MGTPYLHRAGLDGQESGPAGSPAQRLQQVPECCLLFGRPRVSRFALLIQSPFIAHANGVLVVVTGMCPGEVLMARLVELTVSRNIIVVAREAEASASIATSDLKPQNNSEGEWMPSFSSSSTLHFQGSFTLNFSLFT